MGIKRVEIENYKSIKKMYLNMEDLNLLIGENGCGKTNVISSIKYFYENLIEDKEGSNIFNDNNPFSNKIRISITFECKEIQKILLSKARSIKGTENREYYLKILNLIDKNHEITVELVKIKSHPIKWNIDRNLRSIIFNIFPMYFIETKNITSESWNLIWMQIGDLLKLENTLEDKFKDNLAEFINNEENQKIHNKIEELLNILRNSEIQIENYTQKQYAASIAKTYFKGEKFRIAEHNPKYFSDGTNSYNYLSVFIRIVREIKKRKIKFPSIFIDEPEISLHYKYIDKLSEEIISESNNLQFIISTHSSRLLRNVLKEKNNKIKIFNLKNIDKYTKCTEMKLFDDDRQNTFINDEHANCYFSNMLLLVEGESELELFNNKILREIYPTLKNVDIIKASNDNVIKNSILPNKRTYKTPYVVLIDMDKVMVYNNHNTFKKRENYFIYNEKERNFYGIKRIQTNYVRKKIEKMIEKCKFHYRLPFYSCTDSNYTELKNSIKEYFLNYHIFVNNTTIEGMLINYNNFNEFWNFYKSQKQDATDIEAYYNTLKDNDKLNLLRLLVSGKTDYNLNLNQLDKIPVDKRKLIENNKITQKTSGWMSDWIAYYYENTIERYHLEDTQNRLETIRNEFDRDFTELANLIKEISIRQSH